MRLALRALFFTCLVSTFYEQSQAQTITISAAGYGNGTTSFNYYSSTQTFNFSGSFFGYSGYGSSSYSINSANSIMIDGFYLYTTYDELTVPAFSMTRSGSLYSGSFYSSLLGTTVYVSVTDPYDSDSDGIPDLSDNVYNSPPVAPPELINGLRANLGQPFIYSPSFQNAPTYFTATGLPPGISVNSGSGTISGTPTAAGYYYGLLTAYNSSGSASLDIPITIPGTLQSIPFSDDFSAAVSNRYMPLTLRSSASMSANSGVLRYSCSSSDDQGATAAWVLNLPLPLSSSWQVSADVTMPSGWSTPYAGVGLSIQSYLINGTLESVIANRINFKLARDTQDQSVNGNYLNLATFVGDVETSRQPFNTTSTSLSLRFIYDSAQKTISASYRTSPANPWILLGSPQNFNPSSTGSVAQAWGLTSSSSLQVALFADTYATNGTSGKVISLDNLSITTLIPTITSPLTSSGSIAGSFNYQATATGNPTTYNLSGTLPTGLTFNSLTGQITGIPTQSGVFTVSLSATSGSYTGPSVSLRITIPDLVGSFTSNAAASSQWANANSADKAFDNNPASWWCSANGSSYPQTLAYDFGTPTTVSSILLNQWDAAFARATTVELLASSNNRTWIPLQTFTNLGFNTNTLSLSSPQTHRYFALRATAGGPFWAVREVGFQGLLFTSNAAASSQWANANSADKAFDNNPASWWCSANGSSYPQTLAYDFGTPTTVSSILLNQWDAAFARATTVELLASSNNRTWIPLQTFTNLGFNTNTLSLSSPQTHRYFALRATAGGPFWAVREVGFQTSLSADSLPSAPRNLGAVAGIKSATLTWDSPTNNGGFAITSHSIQISTNNGSSWSNFTNSVGAINSFVATNLISGQKYKFRVAAQNFRGTGSFNADNYGTPPGTNFSSFLVNTNPVPGTFYEVYATGIQFGSLDRGVVFYNAPPGIIVFPNLTSIKVNGSYVANIVHGSELVNQGFAYAKDINSEKFYLRFFSGAGTHDIYDSSTIPK